MEFDVEIEGLGLGRLGDVRQSLIVGAGFLGGRVPHTVLGHGGQVGLGPDRGDRLLGGGTRRRGMIVAHFITL